ncbi:MAG: hypothetical protein GXP58_03940 [Deltaproteobacteria bacterium]|nr:hypothetical protein [Deltaproteobacteria bacterium]
MGWNMKRYGGIFFGVALILMWGAAVVPADAGVFHIDVQVILASNSDEGFDPRLLALKKDLLALNYISFQLLDSQGLAVERGETGRLQVPGGRVMEVTPERFSKGKILLRVRINQGESSILTTRLRIEDHGTVILGGPPYRHGFLVLAVTANR